MLVAPTELQHPPFRALSSSGRGSSKPEEFGCDFLFPHRAQWYGVQRKELRDFIASANDGRLYEEVIRMQDCALAILVVEGRPRWSMDGDLELDRWSGHWTEARHYGVLWSAAQKGVASYSTGDVGGTARVVRLFEAWVKKEKHGSLETRPAARNSFGRSDHRLTQCHLAMGIPGVGPELAGRLVDVAGGTPFTLTLTDDVLLSIEGIGPAKLKKIKEAFE